MPDDDASGLESQLRLALFTGAVGWRDRNDDYSPAELAAITLLSAHVIAVVTMLLVSAGLPGHQAAVVGNARWLLAAGAGVTLAVAIGPTIAGAFGRLSRQRGNNLQLRTMAVLRVGAAVVVVGCWTALLGPVAPLPVWPLGGVLGCECALTAWSLGVDMTGRAWWWRFQRSSINAGIVLACMVVVAVGPDQAGEVLAVLLTFQVIAVATASTCAGLNHLRRILDQRASRARIDALTDGHKRLAYWIHNAVTTPLRDVRLRVDAGELDTEDVVAALSEVERQLRARQLEEVLETGSVQVAELLQPHVRWAQEREVEVTEVPRFADPTVAIEGEVGRQVHRALEVLVPNAVAAGATKLAFRVVLAPDDVTVEVEDDAGGFELAEIPAGRALHTLQQEFGPGRVTCEQTATGSKVAVVVAQGSENGSRS
jgi:hypothetical protein